MVVPFLAIVEGVMEWAKHSAHIKVVYLEVFLMYLNKLQTS
jgi:hypothetical protein